MYSTNKEGIHNCWEVYKGNIWRVKYKKWQLMIENLIVVIWIS